MRSRTAARLGLVLALLLALTVLAAPLSRASCAGPQIGLDAVPTDAAYQPSPAPRAVAPGDGLVVVGWFLTPDCNDTVQIAAGCSARPTGPASERPAREVSLVLTQGSNTWRLATGDAGKDLTIAFAVTLPAALTAGPAELTLSFRDDASAPAMITTRPLPLTVR